MLYFVIMILIKNIMSDLTNIEEDSVYVVWLLTVHNWELATETQFIHAQYFLKDLYNREDVETDGYIIGGKILNAVNGVE